jgi:SAM-dependent methyltransferase
MTAEIVRVSPAWLARRESADAAARAMPLVSVVQRQLASRSHPVIVDLGCGTGSMGRWLAAQLVGPQHWVLIDRDPDLLAHAAASLVERSADGAPVTVEIRECDVATLTAGDLAGAGLVTASALLDVLTRDEVDRIAAACAEAATPALLTLSVIGRVRLRPADPLDARVMAAFNDHQRRTAGGRTLLGPDAVEAAITAFARHGLTTLVQPSPWRLRSSDGAERELIAEWFAGWLDAALEQCPQLAGSSLRAYAARRAADIGEGRLVVEVGHQDLLAGCP